jgi:hypothetical protein
MKPFTAIVVLAGDQKLHIAYENPHEPADALVVPRDLVTRIEETLDYVATELSQSKYPYLTQEAVELLKLLKER